MNEEKDKWTHDGQVFWTGGVPWIVTEKLNTVGIYEKNIHELLPEVPNKNIDNPVDKCGII